MHTGYWNGIQKDVHFYADFIDKTEHLEKEIAKFPSLYIEGAAACGKTTAVEMLLAKHKEVRAFVVSLNDGCEGVWKTAGSCGGSSELVDGCGDVSELAGGCEGVSKLSQGLEMIRRLRLAWNSSVDAEPTWVVFENVSAVEDSEVLAEIVDFILHMPDGYRVILTGRERPAEVFLNLIWKRKMELLSQKCLLFSKEDVRMLVEHQRCSLYPDEVYEVTGGWPGCVDLMLRLCKNQIYGEGMQTARQFLQCYEMETYIRREILDTLSFFEREMMNVGAICPWLDVALCEDVFRMSENLKTLQSLERKGLLVKDYKKERWQIAPLFRIYYQNPKNMEKSQSNSWKYLGKWYEQHGHIREALECFRLAEDESLLFLCMMDHYDEIPFLDVCWDEVMEWRESLPELMYLRGMYQYFQGNFKGLRKEIHRIEKIADPDEKATEIHLNLLFVMPEVSMEEWLQFLEHETGEFHNLRLYGILGNSHTFLCGLRDLTELFACAKNDEHKKERLWKEKLDENAYISYQLAKIDYYMETGRDEQLEENERELVWKATDPTAFCESKRKDDYCFAGMNILCKWQSAQRDSDLDLRIQQIKEYLVKEGQSTTVKNAEAAYALYSLRSNKRENLAHWMRYNNDDYPIRIDEENYTLLFFQVRGYILFNQYKKAEKLLASLISYLQQYHRTFLLTECLFLKAIVNRGKNQSNQALRSAIESFVVCGNSRYVKLYTKYGKKGQEVLEQYLEWMKNNAPGGWHRKKKYNYGSVLRMPMEDYLETITRLAKKEVKNYPGLEKMEQEEHLTMMETLILQNLSRGLSNAEICQELNLKLPTVKTHIYSLYKKMGVNSRTQAIVKGKEMGLVK